MTDEPSRPPSQTGTPLERFLSDLEEARRGVADGEPDSGAGAPFLSVLLCTGPGGQITSQETLLSLAAQRRDEVEVLVLAQGIEGAELESLQAMVGDFHPGFARRVRVLALKAATRGELLNHGSRVARGRYLAVLEDADVVTGSWAEDLLRTAGKAPGHLLRTVAAVQELRLCPAAWSGEDGYGALGPPRVEQPFRFDFVEHLATNRTPGDTYALPRDTMTVLGQEWDGSLTGLEDWDLLLRAASLCGVADCDSVGVLTRAWAEPGDAAAGPDPDELDAARRAVVAKLDRRPMLLDRGSMSRLRRVQRAEVSAELANEEVVQLSTQLRMAQEALGGVLHSHAIAHRNLFETQRHLEEVLSSTSWRVMAGPRKAIAALKALARLVLRGRMQPRSELDSDLPPPYPVQHTDPVGYRKWIERFDTVDKDVVGRIRQRLAAIASPPLFSVVVPVHDPSPSVLEATLASVTDQIYEHWNLCIADDASTDPHVTGLLGRVSRRNLRVKVATRAESGHISAATNSALSLAEGPWVAFLDHDDVLAPHALALMAIAIDEHPDAAVLYSDEDKVDEEGLRHSPYFKPEFDPLLLLGQNYLTHFLVVRRDLLADLGGLRQGLEGAQDWDLVLRLSELVAPEQIVHVPHVLYHWRAHRGSTAAAGSAKPYATVAGLRAVADHLERVARPAEVSAVPESGHVRVRWPVPSPAPSVSIVVPTRDGRLLRRCIESVLALTDYSGYEIVIVDNGSRDPGVLDYLDRRRDEQVRVIHDPRPFNYSALNNSAVATCEGDFVCLLNDDTQIVYPEWLSELVAQGCQPGVGAVGAKLLYDNGTLQHAGVLLGIGHAAGHAYRGWESTSPGYMGRLLLAQTMSAVTGACMLVDRRAWNELGGLDEDRLAVAFNDVDFCLRLREAGWRVVWTPYAELFHLESVSRGSEMLRKAGFASEVRYMRDRWGVELVTDPAYNPNLTLVYEDWSLAWPPRISLTGEQAPLPEVELADLAD